MAYFWVSSRFYEAREIAIPDITEALASNPYAADLWQALADYKIAAGEDGEAEMKRVQALRPWF